MEYESSTKYAWYDILPRRKGFELKHNSIISYDIISSACNSTDSSTRNSIDILSSTASEYLITHLSVNEKIIYYIDMLSENVSDDSKFEEYEDIFNKIKKIIHKNFSKKSIQYITCDEMLKELHESDKLSDKYHYIEAFVKLFV